MSLFGKLRRLSVVIPAHNPRKQFLAAVLAALRAQSLESSAWELIVIDNRSDPPLGAGLDLAWHPDARVVREDALGLTRARASGFRQARGDLIVLVDDDNVLDTDYLAQVMRIESEFPFVAVWGGAIRPEYEVPALAPPPSLRSLLSLRDVDADLWSNDVEHHASTPWGAGLCLRRPVAERYLAELDENPRRYELDLQGPVLLYGGDTDIAYTGCRMGYAKGVFRSLSLTHLIPGSRCSEEYLSRVSYGRGYSEVLHHLSQTGSLPAVDGGFGRWARMRYRHLGLSSIERASDRAHRRGRADALRALSKTP